MIPDVRQRTNYDCGPAVVKSVLDHLGLRRSLDHLTSRLLTSPIDGTDPRSIEAYLRHEGLKIVAGEMTLADLRHFCQTGRVVICLTKNHYVAVTKVTASRIYVQDPQAGPCVHRLMDFPPAWVDVDRWGVTYHQFGIAISQ